MYLSGDELIEVVDRAPLVSIDLVVTDADARILVGKRRNDPARDSWFVPGGRILKDEELDEAFSRIVNSELGLKGYQRSASSLLGVYTHRYDTNFMARPGTSTHYVVVAYRLDVKTIELADLPDGQHSEYAWVDLSDECAASKLHPNTAAYGPASSRMDVRQYEMLGQRRNSTVSMLWSTPALTLTGLAFLFTTLLDSSSGWWARAIASGLSVAIVLAALHLMERHRDADVHYSTLMLQFERGAGLAEITTRLPPGRMVRSSSVLVWKVLFLVLLAVASAGFLISVVAAIRDLG